MYFSYFYFYMFLSLLACYPAVSIIQFHLGLDGMPLLKDLREKKFNNLPEHTKPKEVQCIVFWTVNCYGLKVKAKESIIAWLATAGQLALLGVGQEVTT